MFFIFLALQGEVKELRGQLEETCRQNRKLQEHYDEEMDRSVALNSSLKKLNSELDQNKAHTAQIAEEYEAKVLLRFICLFFGFCTSLSCPTWYQPQTYFAFKCYVLDGRVVRVSGSGSSADSGLIEGRGQTNGFRIGINRLKASLLDAQH